MTSSPSSSSRTCRYDVFPSFRGEDVRQSFLSHLIRELERKLITPFVDNRIERGREINPELILSIRESRISIVVFSKNYASSTWCLNELVQIHKCYEELDQIVIPIFYNIDPSHVRKQKGDFGKVFDVTCKVSTENEKRKWIRALVAVANLAGEDSRNLCDDAKMIEKIANDVSNKLITPSNNYGDFVGIEAHIERLIPMLRLGTEGYEKARMIGICGPKGIGKSTIGRALYGRVMSQFHHRAFVQYRRTKRSDFDMKLSWEQQFLSEILRQKDIRIDHLGTVEQRVKNKKVLIFLDDVDDIELLKTLVGRRGWFGSESRIVVISSDRKLLESQKMNRIYEVEYPSEELALQMFCRFAFGRNSPPHGFRELAVEATKLAGNLPDKLNTWGLCFQGIRDKEEWAKMLPNLQNAKIIYDGLDDKDQNHIACSTNGPTNGQCSNSQPQRNMDASHGRDLSSSSQVKVEWIHLLHGVSILLHIRSDGTGLLKYLSYNPKAPEAQHGKAWWSENRENVCEKYNIGDIDRSIDGGDDFEGRNIVRYAALDGKDQGSKYGQCSNSQPQRIKDAINRRCETENERLLKSRIACLTIGSQPRRNMDTIQGRDKLVHDQIRTSNGFSFDFRGSTSVFTASQVDEAKIECESGVYITLGILRNGTRFLKRVDFSRRTAQQAKIWWSENWIKVYGQYNICGIDRSVDGRVHFNVDHNP
ncbi:unnamed protein product [Thlaspi arvense]|uniref:TIR domain-containing protein n=1 Tax=Thlaspi arvense TaxID=13288 RepID=A0AAU9T487_THLAR|nr:unnamed protein product [Thlaspi arvense]